MRDFRKFDVYKRSIVFVKTIYNLTANLPSHEKYGLVSQLTRSAVSIPSNIAEGSSRRSEKDFSRFIEIALGSAFEVETQLLISKEIDYISIIDYTELIKELTIIQKQLNALITTLRK
jgi:four helix bundle protein